MPFDPHSIPDGLPAEPLRENQTSKDLMDTIQDICEASKLPATDIIGALEAVKWVLLKHWLKQDK